jgi:TM2 domain-containing membrane protein YozV
MDQEATPKPPAGWYFDPGNRAQRWWDGNQWTDVLQAPLIRNAKDKGIAYLFAILLGGFAAHSFYLNRIAPGIGFLGLYWGGWLLTTVGVGYLMLIAALVWWIVDLTMIPGWVARANGALP